MISVLVVDDDPYLLELFQFLLTKDSAFQVDSCSSPHYALQKASESNFDVIVSDYHMPGMNGPELLEELKSKGRDFPFIVFTGHLSDKPAIDSIKSGVDFFLIKGDNLQKQIDALKGLIAKTVPKKPEKERVELKEAKYRSVIESLDDSIYMVDRDCRYLYMNQKHLKRLGRLQELYDGMTYQDLHTPEESLRFSDLIKQVFETGQSFDDTYLHKGVMFHRSLEPIKNIEDDAIVAVNIISTKTGDKGDISKTIGSGDGITIEPDHPELSLIHI